MALEFSLKPLGVDWPKGGALRQALVRWTKETGIPLKLTQRNGLSSAMLRAMRAMVPPRKEDTVARRGSPEGGAEEWGPFPCSAGFPPKSCFLAVPGMIANGNREEGMGLGHQRDTRMGVAQ